MHYVIRTLKQLYLFFIDKMAFFNRCYAIQQLSIAYIQCGRYNNNINVHSYMYNGQYKGFIMECHMYN